MDQVYLGRVRGASIYLALEAESAATIDASCLVPDVVPLDGDSIIFANGDVRSVLSIDGSTVSCSDVCINVKGAKGDAGVSPSHKWDGTSLVVTSASGTSAADLKGEKGDTGATGVSIISAMITAV